MVVKGNTIITESIQPGDNFWAFAKALNTSWDPSHSSLLAFDPGETTGYLIVPARPAPWTVGQIYGDIVYQGIMIKEMMRRSLASICVAEDYRVYRSHAKDHINSQIFTARILGVIEYLTATELVNAKLHLRMAGVVKPFCNDAKLVAWGLYEESMRHGRDAIRHALYEILFGNKDLSPNPEVS